MKIEKIKNKWYAKHYSSLNISADQNSVVFKTLHRLIENKADSTFNSNILEVGSGNGEHFSFVERGWKSYTCLDIRTPNRGILNLLRNNECSFQLGDVHSMPFKNSKFDRVISTCLFHHLDNPLVAMMELLRVTKVGGQITILLPNDPGFAYRFFRRHTTLKRVKKSGLQKEQELIHALEHKNHFLSLLVILQDVIKNHSYTIKGFPFPGIRYNLNFVQIINIRKL